ncbi:hypothetical protein [Propylenella binzhouense]|uniref:Uncharacterized protein n=1 Tax=Propylenella binzhouense TaxID=2555902 RepID=A0A964T6M8_9HYPH|nr:hypothetical protein [Propylenella binzhouense]MYZ49478.1 hypothetical protein [Propylenella binzhouense]
MSDSNPALVNLLSRVRDWTPIPEFSSLMQAYFVSDRSEAEKARHREKKGDLKKVRDEIIPVFHHVLAMNLAGDVRFALNDAVPDCWIRTLNAPERGTEVTIALARAAYEQGRALNERGEAPGFLPFQDDAPAEAFRNAVTAERKAYSTDQAIRLVCEGIDRCLRRKAGPRYADLDLLIEAPLNLLPREAWTAALPRLEASARSSPFREVHVVGDPECNPPFGFQIK